MRDAIEAEIPSAEVLIHVEPETSLREPDDSRRRARIRVRLERATGGGSRLTAAARPTAARVIV